MKKDTLCPVPWMHLAFEPSGKIVPCCLTSSHNYFAGDLNTNSIEEIWNGDNMKSLRKKMINGEEPEICNYCFNKEKITGESARLWHKKDFPNVLKQIPIVTEPDGTCNKMELLYWDFRFSNLCNFKCRSCGPRFSSAWVPDAKKLRWIKEADKVSNIETVDDKTNYSFLEDQVKHVQKIYFAGGEPLLMPEHWDILEMLAENKRFDVNLSYNINCSVLEYGQKNVLDYWSLWEYGKLDIWPSIDEIGDRAELVRSGTVWHKVDANLKKLVALDNIILRPSITVSAFNAFRIPAIIDYFCQIGLVKELYKHRAFYFNIVENPMHYHVSVLPDSLRQRSMEQIEEVINKYNDMYNTDISHVFTHVKYELDKPHNPEMAKKFLNISSQIDFLRKESIFQTIPELIELSDMYPNEYKSPKEYEKYLEEHPLQVD